jgi:hypothetical protein
MKHLSAFVILLAGFACGVAPAVAQNASSSNSHPAKKAAAKKAPVEKKEAQDDEPDVKNLQSTAIHCELGNKLTIYGRTANDEQIALHWNKRLHRMTRVTTTTGAHRFENTKSGLVWIDIPAKGMLLDSKKGKQLANECRSADPGLQTAGQG